MSQTKAALAWSAIWAATHTTQYGLAITSLNGIQDAVTCNLDQAVETSAKLRGCIDMTDAKFGLIVSIFTLGGLLGSLGSAYITRRLGRLNAFRLSALSVFIGSLLVGLSNTVAQMLIGRICVGFGTGLATVSVPLFLSEIAPPSIKKSLGIMNQLFIVIGMLLGQSLSIPLTQYGKWRYVFTVSAVLAVLQVLGSYMIQQPRASPQVVVTGDEEEPLLTPARQEASEAEVMSIKDLFTSKDQVIRRGLVIVIVTQLAQQLCGISPGTPQIPPRPSTSLSPRLTSTSQSSLSAAGFALNPVMYFSTRILKPVFSGNSRSIALAIVSFKIPLTILPATIIERTGTRPILLTSSLVMIFASCLLAYGLNTDSAPASALAMVSFVSFFSVGLGPVTWVVLSEVMPREATTAAGSLGIALNWIANFVMGSSFLPVQQALGGGKESGEGNIFYLLAVHCAVAFIAIRLSYAAYDRVKAE